MQDKNTQFQDSFSEEIWKSTYKDHNDTCLTDNFKRMAKSMASAESTVEKQQEWYGKFLDLFTDFKGVAGGRIMSNAGTEWKNTGFLNCYVTPMPTEDIDSIEGIQTVLKNQANTLKSEGGWGCDFSFIRPRGAFIGGVGVESPGAIKFMELFDKSSEIVTSGSGKKSTNKKAKGKIRKGAMMATLSVSHPDIIEFITAKQTQGRLTKFNMSVDCSDAFMELVLKNDDSNWDLEFPDTAFSTYKKEWNGRLSDWKAKGYPVIVYETVKVQYLWNLIMESTYNRAEPGVMFLDRANAFNPLSYGERIISTNPCGL
jgi:ribonucleoside-diphosphate reductase alpha chain